jgi:chemotaxis family two-component system response regulator PixG
MIKSFSPAPMIKSFSPVQLLAQISSSHGSGRLDVASGSASWRIYIQDGELKYVECSVQSRSQLGYHLCREGWNDAYELLKRIQAPESSSTDLYPQVIEEGLSWLLENQHLDATQAVQILKSLTQDSLESFLWLTEGSSSFLLEQQELPEWIIAIAGNTMTFDLAEMVKLLQQRMRGWQGCLTEINSPYHRPYLLDYRNIAKTVPTGTLSDTTLKKLAKLMRGFSIRQLSLLLQHDELHIAKMLSPYVKQKVIYLRDPKPPFDRLPKIPRLSISRQKPPQPKITKTYKIVCIDDSPTILSEIQRFLEDERFQVTTVDDPIEASAIIFRLKPDLILLDISMPKINGYRLCGLLRSSSMFDSTPIIMVTGNTGFLDKARAKLAGATDYLTKPFTRSGLNSVVHKYLEVL